MNKDIISGNWEEIKGKIKATWGKLTDDDLAVMQGKTQEVIGKLQATYGYSRERAEEEWKSFSEKNESCRSKSKESCCS